jgi:hypothetical protein
MSAFIKTKPPTNELRGGTDIGHFLHALDIAIAQGNKVTLDLSEVRYMDTTGFRAVFDRLPKLSGLIPPLESHIVDMYNSWLDSKKGLTK